MRPSLTVLIVSATLLFAVPLTASAFETYDFDLPSGCKESLWRDALARQVGGRTEQTSAVGRADVMTATEVYEVDWIRKWKEGMGQVLAYAGETGRKPVLALIAYSQGAANLTAKTKATLALAEKECARHGVRLIVLFPTQPELRHTPSVNPQSRK